MTTTRPDILALARAALEADAMGRHAGDDSNAILIEAGRAYHLMDVALAALSAALGRPMLMHDAHLIVLGAELAQARTAALSLDMAKYTDDLVLEEGKQP